MRRTTPRYARQILASLTLTLGLFGLSGLSGCAPSASDDGSGGGSDWTLSDTGGDVGTDGGDGTTTDDTDGGRRAVETTFTLKNESDTPLSFEPMGLCATGGSWLSLHDGSTSVALESSCATCDCATVEREGGCAVCAIGCPQSEPPAPTIAPGDSKSFTWDGVGYREDQVEGQTCSRSWTPPRGEELTAEFCVLDSSASDGKRCRSVSFEYGNDQNVTASFDAQKEPVETSFSLTNETGYDVTVEEIGHCTGTDQWISLRDGDTRVDLQESCTVCSCSEPDCGICKVRCPEPAPPVLRDGESKTFEWNGVGHRRQIVSDERTCQQKWVPSRGTQLKARFCVDVELPSALRPEQRCKTVTFRYGEKTSVSAVFEPKREPVEHTVRIENQRSLDIQVAPYSARCTSNPPGWASLTRNGSEVSVSPSCGCACETLRDDGICPACATDGAPCRPNEIYRELDTGESASWTWDGQVYRQKQYDDQTCYEKSTPRPGTSFEIGFCWREPIADGGYREECTTKPLSYGADTAIVKTVQ